MPAAKRVLLTTCPPPYPVHPAHRDGIDQFGLRFTKHQGQLQIPIDYPFHLGTHLIARNLQARVTVLDAPTPLQLWRELCRGPDVVGLSFPTVLMPQALQVARLVRALAPRATLVLGGHGVLCLGELEQEGGAPAWLGAEARAQSEELRQLAHEVCVGDGIGFMRRLLGQPPGAAVDGVLPPSGIMRPFGLPLIPARNMVSLAPALGCSGRCAFCTTSAFFGGKRRTLLQPGQAVRSIRQQLKHVPRGQTAIGVVMDEDLLVNRDWFTRFGEQLADDELVRERGFTYTTFGSIRAAQRYSTEQLLRYRVSNLWVGVESMTEQTGVSYLDRKRHGVTPKAFERLHHAGISTIASFILGWDFQDRQRLQQEAERFLALRPTMAQVLPLLPAPGTQLWREMSAAGRINRVERWQDAHYYSEHFRYQKLSTEELWRAEDQIEQRLFREQGPAYLKLAQVYLSGLEAQRDARDPSLANVAQVFARFLRDLRPVLAVIRRGEHGPQVKQLERRISARAEQLLGPPTTGERLRSGALQLYTAAQRAGLWGARPTQPSSHRTVYHNGRAVRSPWGRP